MHSGRVDLIVVAVEVVLEGAHVLWMVEVEIGVRLHMAVGAPWVRCWS